MHRSVPPLPGSRDDLIVAQLYTCVPGNGSNDDLTFPGGVGDPGYIFIDDGTTQNCNEAPPAGAPGAGSWRA